MENNKYTPQQIAKAVAHRFKGGTVATVTTNEIVVRVGKSFTRLPLHELKQAVAQSSQAPKEDLHQLARELNAKEDGVTANTNTGISERDFIASKYGI